MSLKLFKFTQGAFDYYGAFKDIEDAYDRRAEVDPTFHYAHCEIAELTLDGYEIAVYHKTPLPAPDPVYLPFTDIELEEEPEVATPAKNKGGRPRKETYDASPKGNVEVGD